MYVPKIIFKNQTILTRVIAKNVWDPFLRPSAEKILQCIFCELTAVSMCLQCFDAVGWAAGRASGL